MNVYKHLMCGNQRDTANLFSVVCGDRTRGNGHKLKRRKFCTNMQNFFMGRVIGALEWAAVGDGGVVSSGDIPDPSGCRPVQPAAGSCLGRGLGSLSSGGPFPPLQFCDSVKDQPQQVEVWNTADHFSVLCSGLCCVASTAGVMLVIRFCCADGGGCSGCQQALWVCTSAVAQNLQCQPRCGC